MLKRLLIVNRGEIACRIIKTARQMGVTTIAIYSDVDANALYVQQADEAYAIGKAPALESYLNIDKIIALAKKVSVDAIHPGYGFLAENAQFALACENAGIIFVGPSSEHIRLMGLKNEAKAIAEKYGCPVLPEFNEKNLAFPLLIKPIAGGGGKGMQIVETASDFPEKLTSAKRQALNSFGNDAVILEKYLGQPRHIEIQVLADQHGHAIYLFERDCSLQRRYQKIIEQAPAPEISQTVREQMGQAALKIVNGLGYVGAGTVEFLLEDNQFYFMEMNTRLQVEHGVTELITGIDLVEWQLRIAAREVLSLQQQDLRINGAAIEARLYAEDPSEDFLPATGTVSYLHWPDNVRIDNGIKVGDKISIYYDPLLAKVLVHAQEGHVWNTLHAALAQIQIAGVKTNLDFLRNLTHNQKITQHPVDTHYIDNHPQLCEPKVIQSTDLVLGLMGYLLNQKSDRYGISPWQSHKPWRLNAPALQRVCLYFNAVKYEFLIEYQKEDYQVHFQNAIYTVSFAQRVNETLRVEINQQEYQRTIIFQQGRIWLLSPEYDILLTIPEISHNASDSFQQNSLRAPMPGKIVQILVKEQEKVEAQQSLVILEAMKMEHTLRAPYKGVIKAIHFQVNDQIQEGDVVVEMEK